MASEISQIQPVGRFLSRTGKSFLHLLNVRLSDLDIDRNYYALLLIELGEGNLTQQELANQLETDKVSVVRIVDYLAVNGYVKRVRSTSDHRKYSLTLTGKAKERIPAIRKAMKEVTEEAYKGLSENQVQSFLATLSTVKNNLSNAKTQGL